ncbi:MAG TPA: EamA family transporter [Gemmatimonadales bacterium]|nr:EamA family transporter [Gemmatimonadales bacterium]
MAPERAARVRLLTAFAAIYLIWGSTYLAIAIAIRSVPPFLMAGCRVVLAGIVIYLWARLRGQPAPRPAQWAWALLLGGLFFLIGNGAVVWVEQFLPSGITALIIAMVSVWTAILEWLGPRGERPSALVFGGIGLGFLGVALLVLPGNVGGGHVDPGGVLVLMGSTFAWALGAVLSRGADLPSGAALVSGMQMLTGGTLLLLASLVHGDARRFDPAAVTPASVGAFFYLVVFGSVVAFTCFSWLLRVTSPNKVATGAYVNPMVAMVLGWALGGEPMTLRSLLASIVIVGAVVLIITGRELVQARRPAGALAADPVSES